MPTDTNTNTDTSGDHHGEQRSPQQPSRRFSCNTCQLSFGDVQEQRAHMKTSLHVYNIKRRLASLSPASDEDFEKAPEERILPKETYVRKVIKTAGVRTSAVRSSSSSSSSSNSSDAGGEAAEVDSTEKSASPFHCLFCAQEFTEDEAGLMCNLTHMHTVHGLFIPSRECVADMQTFLSYLATEVRTWHECLYCGTIKDSALSIQSHMRDKQHCTLNFDREPELLDFWEAASLDDETAAQPSKDQKRSSALSETEILLDSGKVIESRHAGPPGKGQHRSRRSDAETTNELAPFEHAHASAQSVAQHLGGEVPLPPVGKAPGRQLARREEMGITGVTVHQRQALLAAEKKAQRSEAVARRAKEWVYAKGANQQKFDQLDNQRKWGKQNHKLLPR